MFLSKGSKQNYYWWPENWPMFLFLVVLNFLVLTLIVKRLPPSTSALTAHSYIYSFQNKWFQPEHKETQSEREREEKAEIRWASTPTFGNAAIKTQIMPVTGHASLFNTKRKHWDFVILLTVFNKDYYLCCDNLYAEDNKK